jgi:hypothetical protein
MKRCDRCKKETVMYKMSWFNRDMICPDCEEEEEAHPLFKKAKEIENEQVKRGNMNYPGVFGDKTWNEIKLLKTVD